MTIFLNHVTNFRLCEEALLIAIWGGSKNIETCFILLPCLVYIQVKCYKWRIVHNKI